MKRKILGIIISIAIITCVLAGCAIDGGFKVNGVYHISTGTKDTGRLEVLVVSDIMFDGSEVDSARRQMFTDLVNKADEYDEDIHYEFIVVNGNTVNGENNGELMKSAVTFIDSFKIPWAITLGASDIDGTDSKTDIMKILKDSKYGIMSEATYMDKTGNDATYMVDVFNDKDTFITSLYFVDTTVECSDKLVEWYTNTVKSYGYEYGNKDGDNVNSVIFMHTALSNHKQKVTDDNDVIDPEDVVTVWENSSNFSKAIISLKSTIGVFVARDTLNSNSHTVNNIKWEFSKSLYLPNGDIKSQDFITQARNTGGTKLALASSSYISTSQKRLTASDYFEKVENRYSFNK